MTTNMGFTDEPIGIFAKSRNRRKKEQDRIDRIWNQIKAEEEAERRRKQIWKDKRAAAAARKKRMRILIDLPGEQHDW